MTQYTTKTWTDDDRSIVIGEGFNLIDVETNGRYIRLDTTDLPEHLRNRQ